MLGIDRRHESYEYILERITTPADHSKFPRRGPLRLAEVSRISVLVTDRAAPEAGVRLLREQGVEVVLV